MKLKELLKADWNIDELEIKVYTNSRLVAEYRIGRHLGRPQTPPKYHRFLYTTKAGDVYGTRNKVDGNTDKVKIVLIDKGIQYGSECRTGGVGVILGAIPKELLELQVDYLMPYGWGSMEFHGYYIHLVSDLWTGIAGEDEVVEDEHE